MAVPTVPVFQAGETTTLTGKLGQVSAAITFLLNPPHAYAYKPVNGALASSTWDVVSLGAELYDWSVTGMHSTSTNSSRITAPETGIYNIEAFAKFEANAAGSRGLEIKKNAAGVETGGTQVYQEYRLPATNSTGFISASIDYPLTAGDYVELFVWQNTGGALNVLGGASTLYLSIRWSSLQ